MPPKASGRRCVGASRRSSAANCNWRPIARRALESHAQHIAAQLLARHADLSGPATPPQGHDVQQVDVDSLELIRPRSVGVEHVGLWAMDQLGLRSCLQELGIGPSLRATAIGSIIARMARPGSERATRRWLGERSALDELLGVDFQTLEPMQLYRASDALMAHREAIEHHLFDRAMDLFDLHPTVTLYDLTNTYFEGEAGGQPKARRGHSKEKRTDCPLLTLGLVLDASGFVRRSQVFAGNVREHHTLAEMLDALNAPRAALVVMDRGIATEDRVRWLRDEGYRYLVVSRERTRHFDAEAAVRIETASSHGVHLHKVLSEDGQEVRLYCFSEERAAKERGSSRASPNASRTHSPSSPKGYRNRVRTNDSTRSGSASAGSKLKAAASPSTTPSSSTPTNPDNAPPPYASPAARSAAR